jgi:CMP-N-acetylneuraminic acid synthetase
MSFVNKTIDEVWIPAQRESSRCRDKNFRSFYKNKSLIDILLDKIRGTCPKARIILSSEMLDESFLKKNRDLTFVTRPSNILGNSIRQSDLISHFAKQSDLIEKKNCVVLIAQCTDPFFNEFEKMIEFYFEDIKNSNKLIPEISGSYASYPLKKQIFREKQIINGGLGNWHEITQELSTCDVVRWSAFISSKYNFLKSGYQIVPKANPFRSFDFFIDIDEERDFILAQKIYECLRG